MGESHTKGAQLHRPVTPEGTSGQSAMARASGGRPFKPYVYRGGEPAAVTAARERHRALNAAAEAARAGEAMPDPAPGWEWYRELAAEDEVAELAAGRDRYQAAMAAVPGPREPDPPPAPPPRYGAQPLQAVRVPDDRRRPQGGVR
jgi:hypothetical protein